MKIYNYNKQTCSEILNILRNRAEYAEVQSTVDKIITDIKKTGDSALFKYTLQFDAAVINSANIRVTSDDITEAYSQTNTELVETLKRAFHRIYAYHQKQVQRSWLDCGDNGEILGQLVRPVESCGVYVPGGKAAYPSTVLMNIAPAVVAGVKRIVMATPVKETGRVNAAALVAADIAGATEIYKAGGAQAIAALAYGTESIKKVDKITGPGNIYVATAKRSVYGQTDIDSVAGPSEILIIADDSANPVYVAADLLSQAEHDEMASAILVTTSRDLAEKVVKELDIQINKLDRKNIAIKSIKNYSAAIIAESLNQAAEISDLFAPEHLEIAITEPFTLLNKIHNAGAIFLGHYTPEPLGDYMAGPNHVLPTGGTSRFFSPLSVDDYIKKTSVLSFSQSAMKAISKDVICLAEAEGLTGHANSVRVRL